MEASENSVNVSRRRFLRRSFAFSALATLGSLPRIADALQLDETAAELLMVGDWGYDDDHAPQAGVARGMRLYAQQQGLKAQALLMLGDNWYGELGGGVHSPRWKTQFEEMYSADRYPGPAYAVLGNHDYETSRGNKVEAEVAYARQISRWTMPQRAWRRSCTQRHHADILCDERVLCFEIVSNERTSRVFARNRVVR